MLASDEHHWMEQYCWGNEPCSALYFQKLQLVLLFLFLEALALQTIKWYIAYYRPGMQNSHLQKWTPHCTDSTKNSLHRGAFLAVHFLPQQNSHPLRKQIPHSAHGKNGPPSDQKRTPSTHLNEHKQDPKTNEIIVCLST